MMRRILSRLRHGLRDERGIAAVEFALLSIPLFVIVLGVIDFGLGIWTYNNLSEAVRQGARAGVVRGADTTLATPPAPNEKTVPPATCDSLPALTTATGQVIEQVCTYAFALDPSRLSVTVTWGGSVGIVGKVEVLGAYAYQPLLSGVFPFPPINLRSQAEMRIGCCQ